MSIYIVNLFITFTTLLISRCFKVEKIIKYYFIIVSFISVLSVSGLRFQVGTDYNEYINLFNQVINDKNSSFFLTLEPIFIYICKIINIFSQDYIWLFIITSFFIIFFIFKVVIKECEFYELGIFLFLVLGFFTSSLNIVRQWMAAVVLLYGYTQSRKGYDKKFLLCILVSFLCHYSAIIVIFFFSFIMKNKNEKYRLFFIISGFLFFGNTAYIIKFFQFLCLKISILNKYYKYLNPNEDIGGSVLVLPMFCLVTYFIYLWRKKFLNLNIYCNILCLGFFFSIIGQKLMVFNRLQYYFVCILIILIPELIKTFNQKERTFIYILCIILGTIFYLYTLKINGGHPLPYQSILDRI